MPQPNIMAEMIKGKEFPLSSQKLPLSHLLHTKVSLFLHFSQYFIHHSPAEIIDYPLILNGNDAELFQVRHNYILSLSNTLTGEQYEYCN